jgi:tetratricopeptide (TPR) repeat protein/NAD-dependent dihydropyrimidine dehydrogenase PreA subunit
VTTSNQTDIPLPLLKKRKHSSLRWTILISVQALIIAHIVIWFVGKQNGWFGGKTISPIEPSEGMEFVKNGIINAGAIFFALALLSTLIFGRWFCGWGCHIVLLQDWCYWLLRKMHIRPKPFRARFLMLFPFGLAVYMFIWPLFYRFVIVKLPWPEITTQLLTDDYWSTFASPLVAVPFLLICGFATVYVLGAKGFCTYGCPYGGFFKPLDAVSPMHVRVNDDCQQCGKCTAVCTSNVRVHEEVNLYKMVIDSGCMKIMDCIDACPNDALSIGFGKIAVGQRTKKRKYDLSLVEELVVAAIFLCSFFAFRSLYAIVPMLMAVGMALVVTWIFWKAWRVIVDQNVSFHSRQLKFHGKLKSSGVLFLLVAIISLLFTVHSAAIQTFKYLGDYELKNNNIENAMQYYNWASPLEDGGFAIASNPNVDVELAHYYDSENEHQKAHRLFLRIDRRVGSDEESTMYLGRNLQHHKQYPEIDALYSERLSKNPHWEFVWEEYIGWLRRDGLHERAILKSTTAVNENPTAKRLRIQLALLHIDFGDPEVGVFISGDLVDEYQEDPSMWMLFARALDRSGRREKAQQAVNVANQIQESRLQNEKSN